MGRKFIAIVLAATVLLSCGRRPEPARAREVGLDWLPGPAARSREAADAGRFLAGIDALPESPFQKLESQESWAEHRRESAAVWGRVESKWLPPMKAFQASALNGPEIAETIVFYPFSGPDVLTMTVLFPRNPVYVMIGLEPPGTVPAAGGIPGAKLAEYLAAVRQAVSSEFQRSFFVTREMDKDFRGQVTDGLASPMLLLLARAGNEILGHRYVRLDQDGRVIERPPQEGAAERVANRGIQIDFRSPGGAVHRIFYLSANLADRRLKGNAALRAFLARLNGVTTLLKATSYMPHHDDFTLIREVVLARSDAILQDDSGIPFRYLNTGAWQVTLYGDYEKPYGSFAWLEQPDLRAAYRERGPKPLGFEIGYGFARIPSNLQLAVRLPGASSAR